MNCVKCTLPLRIIAGGNKSSLDSTNIVTVHVFGCVNPDCEMKMIEQNRAEVENDSFIE